MPGSPDVISRLADVVGHATVVWQDPRNARASAVNQRIGVSQEAYRRLMRNQIHLYELQVLGKIVWYFGLERMSDLLLYVPPDQTVSEVIAAAAPPLVRVAPPIGTMPSTFTIRSTIAAHIHTTTAAVLARQTGLGRATLHWLKQHDPPAQIKRSTLAALCTSGVPLDALLVVAHDNKK